MACPSWNSAFAGTGTSAPPGRNVISFAADIGPLVASRCTPCHTQSPFFSNFSMLTYDSLLQGGIWASQGFATVVAGDHTESHMWQAVSDLSAVVQRMPFGRPALPQAEIDLIAQWIDEGAERDAPSVFFRPGLDLALIQFNLQQYQASFDTAQRWLVGWPDDNDALRIQVGILLIDEQPLPAIELLERMILIDPDHEEAKQLLRQIRQMLDAQPPPATPPRRP